MADKAFLLVLQRSEMTCLLTAVLRLVSFQRELFSSAYADHSH